METVKLYSGKLKDIPRSKTGLILTCNACDAIDQFVDTNEMGYCKQCHDEIKKEGETMKTKQWSVFQEKDVLGTSTGTKIKVGHTTIAHVYSSYPPEDELFHAKRIVRCVNSHDGLIKALNELSKGYGMEVASIALSAIQKAEGE